MYIYSINDLCLPHPNLDLYYFNFIFQNFDSYLHLKKMGLFSLFRAQSTAKDEGGAVTKLKSSKKLHHCCETNTTLQNHQGKLCTVFNCKYIFTLVNGTQLLIPIIAPKRIISWALGSFIWQNQKLQVLSNFPDGTEVNFDAIKIFGTSSYQILLIWLDQKVRCFSLPFNKSILLLKCHHEVPCEFVDENKNTLSLCIDGKQMVLGSPLMVTINGKKMSKNDFQMYQELNSTVIEILKQAADSFEYCVIAYALYYGNIPAQLERLQPMVIYSMTPDAMKVSCEYQLIFLDVLVQYNKKQQFSATIQNKKIQLKVSNMQYPIESGGELNAHIMCSGDVADGLACLLQKDYCSDKTHATNISVIDNYLSMGKSECDENNSSSLYASTSCATGTSTVENKANNYVNASSLVPLEELATVELNSNMKNNIVWLESSFTTKSSDSEEASKSVVKSLYTGASEPVYCDQSQENGSKPPVEPIWHTFKPLIKQTIVPSTELISEAPAESMSEPQAEPTNKPQDKSTSESQPESASEQQAESTSEPQHKSTSEPQVKSTIEQQGKAMSEPQPETTGKPQNKLMSEQLESTSEPQDKATSEIQAESTSKSQHRSTCEQHTESTSEPQGKSTSELQAESTSEPRVESTSEPQHKSTGEPHVESMSESQAKSTSEPQAESTSEPHAESMHEPQTESTMEPQDKSMSELQAESTDEPQTESICEQQAESTCEYQTKSADKSEAESMSEPQMKYTDEPQAESTNEPQAEPTSEPQAEPTSESKAESTSEPKAESRVESQAESASEPPTESTDEQAESKSEPQMVSTSEPQAESTSEPQAESMGEPQAESVDEPQAKSTHKLQVQSSSEPQAKSTSEPQAESRDELQAESTDKPQAKSMSAAQAQSTNKHTATASLDEPVRDSTTATSISSIESEFCKSSKSVDASDCELHIKRMDEVTNAPDRCQSNSSVCIMPNDTSNCREPISHCDLFSFSKRNTSTSISNSLKEKLIDIVEACKIGNDPSCRNEIQYILEDTYKELSGYCHIPVCSESSTICFEGDDIFFLKDCTDFKDYSVAFDLKVLVYTVQYALVQDEMRNVCIIIPNHLLMQLSLEKSTCILYSNKSQCKLGNKLLSIGFLSWNSQSEGGHLPVLQEHICNKHDVLISVVNDMSFIRILASNNQGAPENDCSASIHIDNSVSDAGNNLFNVKLIPARIIAFQKGGIYISTDSPGYPKEVLCSDNKVFLRNMKKMISCVLQNEPFNTEITAAFNATTKSLALIFDVLDDDCYVHLCDKHPNPVILKKGLHTCEDVFFEEKSMPSDYFVETSSTGYSVSSPQNVSITNNESDMDISDEENSRAKSNNEDDSILKVIQNSFSHVHTANLKNLSILEKHQELNYNDHLQDNYIIKSDVINFCNKDVFLKSSRNGYVTVRYKINSCKILLPLCNIFYSKDNKTRPFVLKKLKTHSLNMYLCFVKLEQPIFLHGVVFHMFCIWAFVGNFANKYLAEASALKQYKQPLCPSEVDDIISLRCFDESSALTVLGKVVFVADSYGVIRFTLQNRGKEYYSKFSLDSIETLPKDGTTKFCIKDLIGKSCIALVHAVEHLYLDSECSFSAHRILSGSIAELTKYLLAHSDEFSKFSKNVNIITRVPLDTLSNAQYNLEHVLKRVTSHKTLNNSLKIICDNVKINNIDSEDEFQSDELTSVPCVCECHIVLVKKQYLILKFAEPEKLHVFLPLNNIYSHSLLPHLKYKSLISSFEDKTINVICVKMNQQSIVDEHDIEWIGLLGYPGLPPRVSASVISMWTNVPAPTHDEVKLFLKRFKHQNLHSEEKMVVGKLFHTINYTGIVRFQDGQNKYQYANFGFKSARVLPSLDFIENTSAKLKDIVHVDCIATVKHTCRFFFCQYFASSIIIGSTKELQQHSENWAQISTLLKTSYDEEENYTVNDEFDDDCSSQHSTNTLDSFSSSSDSICSEILVEISDESDDSASKVIAVDNALTKACKLRFENVNEYFESNSTRNDATEMKCQNANSISIIHASERVSEIPLTATVNEPVTENNKYEIEALETDEHSGNAVFNNVNLKIKFNSKSELVQKMGNTETISNNYKFSYENCPVVQIHKTSNSSPERSNSNKKISSICCRNISCKVAKRFNDFSIVTSPNFTVLLPHLNLEPGALDVSTSDSINVCTIRLLEPLAVDSFVVKRYAILGHYGKKPLTVENFETFVKTAEPVLIMKAASIVCSLFAVENPLSSFNGQHLPNDFIMNNCQTVSCPEKITGIFTKPITSTVKSITTAIESVNSAVQSAAFYPISITSTVEPSAVATKPNTTTIQSMTSTKPTFPPVMSTVTAMELASEQKYFEDNSEKTCAVKVNSEECDLVNRINGDKEVSDTSMDILEVQQINGNVRDEMNCRKFDVGNLQTKFISEAQEILKTKLEEENGNSVTIPISRETFSAKKLAGIQMSTDETNHKVKPAGEENKVSASWQHLSCKVAKTFDDFSILHTTKLTVLLPHLNLIPRMSKMSASMEKIICVSSIVLSDPQPVESYMVDRYAFLGYYGKKPPTNQNFQLFIENADQKMVMKYAKIVCSRFASEHPHRSFTGQCLPNEFIINKISTIEPCWSLPAKNTNNAVKPATSTMRSTATQLKAFSSAVNFAASLTKPITLTKSSIISPTKSITLATNSSASSTRSSTPVFTGTSLIKPATSAVKVNVTTVSCVLRGVILHIEL